MTKDELYAEIQKRGIEGMSSANKDELVSTLEADDRGEITGRGGLMATTTLRRDFLMRRVLNPGTTATDFLGRLTTSTLDSDGHALVARDFPVSGAVTLGEYIDIPATRIVYQVTVAGTTAGAAPTAPGVGSTVVSNTATFLQITNQ